MKTGAAGCDPGAVVCRPGLGQHYICSTRVPHYVYTYHTCITSVWLYTMLYTITLPDGIHYLLSLCMSIRSPWAAVFWVLFQFPGQQQPGKSSTPWPVVVCLVPHLPQKPHSGYSPIFLASSILGNPSPRAAAFWVIHLRGQLHSG